ncbi:hypothetical protein [Akkermansia muciniphila]|uniref:hypothetical protein n=1 Tax=Akkermansia muciniphila TaxID=239935 RepID=UPI00319E1985
MNTIRHIQGSWIKKRILSALLLGVCCLFYPHNALSQDEPGAPPQKTGMQLDMEKGMAQARERFGEQLYNQYMGGATTVGQQAVGITQMENAIAEAEGNGNTGRANMLREQLALAQSVNQRYLKQLKQKADAGDAGAQRELDEYYELIKTSTPSLPAVPFVVSIIFGLLVYWCMVLFSPRDTILNRKTLILWCVGLTVFDMLGNLTNSSWLFLFGEVLAILLIARSFKYSWKRTFSILGIVLVSVLILGGLLTTFL